MVRDSKSEPCTDCSKEKFFRRLGPKKDERTFLSLIFVGLPKCPNSEKDGRGDMAGRKGWEGGGETPKRFYLTNKKFSNLYKLMSG